MRHLGPLTAFFSALTQWLSALPFSAAPLYAVLLELRHCGDLEPLRWEP